MAEREPSSFTGRSELIQDGKVKIERRLLKNDLSMKVLEQSLANPERSMIHL